eukprot:403361488
MGMKLENPNFDMRNLIKMDFSVDLSMVQSAISYLFKTSALHDKEFMEMRQQQTNTDRTLTKLYEEYKDYTYNNSKKSDVKQMKKDLEELVLEKMIEYDDHISEMKVQIQQIRDRKGKFRQSKSPVKHQQQESAKQVQSFIIEELRETSLLAGSQEFKQNIDRLQLPSEDVMSQQTGRQEQLFDLQDQLNLMNERVTDLSTKLKLVGASVNINITGGTTTNKNGGATSLSKTFTNMQSKLKESSTQNLDAPEAQNQIIDAIDNLKDDLDTRYVKKREISKMSKQEIQILEQASIQELIDNLNNEMQMLRDEISFKANQDDFENLINAINNGNPVTGGQNSMLSSPVNELADRDFTMPQGFSQAQGLMSFDNRQLNSSTQLDPQLVDGTLKITPMNKMKQQKINSQQLTQNSNSPNPIKMVKKMETTLILPKAPEENNRFGKLVIGGGNKDAKQMRDMQAKIYNLEKIIEQLKAQYDRSSSENNKTLLSDLQAIVDKKANILDLKKLAAVVDEVNVKIQEVTKEQVSFKECDFFLGEKGRTSAIMLRSLDNKAENVDQALKKLQQTVVDLTFKLNDSIKLLMIGGGNSKDYDTTMDERLQKEVKDKTDVAIQECIRIKEQITKQFSQLEKQIIDKASREDLTNLDDHLSRSLDQVVANCNKLYAKKGELNKLMRDTDVQIKTLQEYTFRGGSRSNNNRSASLSPGDPNKQPLQTDHEVILATKPLGGWSCGSCGTNINGLPNMPSNDYNTWGRLPARDNKISMLTNQKASVNPRTHKPSISVDIQDQSHLSVKKLVGKQQYNFDISKLGISGQGAMTERQRVSSPYKTLDGNFNVTHGGDLENIISGFNSNPMTIREERPQSTKSLTNQKSLIINSGAGSTLPKIVLQKQNRQKQQQ